MRILQISCGYLPDSVGGTEVYVHHLSKGLKSIGHEIFVTYISDFARKNEPEYRCEEYTIEDVPVFVIEKNTIGLKTPDLYFDRKKSLLALFQDFIERIKPDILHFHHFSPTDVLVQMEAAKGANLPVILTYHTPMMTCGHQDMLYLGKRPCDGVIRFDRCLICAQTKYGIPFGLAYLWSKLPMPIAEILGKFISESGLGGRFFTWLQLPWLTFQRIKRWKMGLNMTDHFVAVCDWVYKLLENNDIPGKRISLCRQGVGKVEVMNTRESKSRTLRLGYIGRAHPVKGIDVLLRAFNLVPSDWEVELNLFISPQDYRLRASMAKKFNTNSRIKFQKALQEKDKFNTLAGLDLLVIPSIWLETGPLVLLESWAVGTPIIGARLGGISELVKDGVGGLLFDSGDYRGLFNLIQKIYKDRQLLKKIKDSIPSVRSMDEVAIDMEALYKKVLTSCNSRNA